MNDVIRMQFPADTEYISTIRLAVSGLAGRMDYNLDEIEDLKACVAEACLLLLCRQNCSGLDIIINIDKVIRLSVNGVDVQATKRGEESCTEFNEEISKLMIEALSEEAEFKEEDGVLTSIAFVKSHTA